MNLSIFTKGLLLIAVTLAFHLGFIGLMARMQGEYAQAQLRASHSQQVIRDAQIVLRSATDADTAVRRLVVKPENEHSQRYEHAAQAVPAAVGRLRAQVADNADQRNRRKRGDAADAALAWLAETVRLVRPKAPGSGHQPRRRRRTTPDGQSQR